MLMISHTDSHVMHVDTATHYIKIRDFDSNENLWKLEYYLL